MQNLARCVGAGRRSLSSLGPDDLHEHVEAEVAFRVSSSMRVKPQTLLPIRKRNLIIARMHSQAVHTDGTVGRSKRPLWAILKDVLDKPIAIHPPTDHSAKGAAQKGLRRLALEIRESRYSPVSNKLGHVAGAGFTLEPHPNPPGDMLAEVGPLQWIAPLHLRSAHQVQGCCWLCVSNRSGKLTRPDAPQGGYDVVFGLSAAQNVGRDLSCC
mmetsp:Transcript_66408/g.151999  ORF Transcript_66408/g.151999 Transcript_66408/m.151999 type:complete len:212 (+) Transcript_66408:2004-2639(+)